MGIDRTVPGLEAVDVSGLGEELPDFLGIVWVRLQRQGTVELARDNVPRQGRIPSVSASLMGCRLMAWFAARRTRLSYHGD